MSKIKIITDSGSDISWERAQELGIRMLPISFTFDGETDILLHPRLFCVEFCNGNGFIEDIAGENDGLCRRGLHILRLFLGAL